MYEFMHCNESISCVVVVGKVVGCILCTDSTSATLKWHIPPVDQITSERTVSLP